MGGSVVGREGLLGLEDSVNDVDDAVVSGNVLDGDEASGGEAGKALGALLGGAEEEAALLVSDVHLGEG